MKITRVHCKECDKTMAASSLKNRTERAHGRVFKQVRGVDVGGGGMDIYKVSFHRILKLVD